MHIVVVGLALFCFQFIQPSGLHAQDGIRDLVVKIHATHHTPDLLRPWAKNSPQQVKGSGVVIDGKRILTNAHVVCNQEAHGVELQRHHQRHELVWTRFSRDAPETAKWPGGGAGGQARRIAQELARDEIAEVGRSGQPERR